ALAIFLVSWAGLWRGRRDAYLREDFAGMKLRREHVHKEIARRDRSCARRIRRNDFRIERENGRGIIAARIGMRQAAADRAASTYLDVADLRARMREQRNLRCQ